MTGSEQVAGVILAGGRSSRMGGADKTFAMLAGLPMVAWSVARLRPQTAALVVSTNALAARFASFDLPLLEDPFGNHPGPLAGVLAGLDWAAGRYDAVVTVAVDTPFFPFDLVERLSVTGSENLRVARSGDRIHPVFALWPCRLRNALRAFLQSGRTGRVMSFLEEQGCEAVDFPAIGLSSGPVDPFFNVNAPGDLARAQEIAGEMKQ